MQQRPALHTERLLLRPFVLADAKDVQRLAGEKAIADTTANIPHPYLDGMAEQWIATHQERCEAGEVVNFALVLQGAGVLIGAISLMDLSARHERGELGYWIGQPYWNKGYCTEAAQAVLTYGFSILGLIPYPRPLLEAESCLWSGDGENRHDPGGLPASTRQEVGAI